MRRVLLDENLPHLLKRVLPQFEVRTVAEAAGTLPCPLDPQPRRPRVSVTIPDDVLQAARMTEAELREELAVVLYQRERLTAAQAARLAGMDRLRFQHLLASRGLPLHYDVLDFEADLQTLADLGRL